MRHGRLTEGSPVKVTATLGAALSDDASPPLTVTRGTSADGDHGTLASITVSASQTTGTGSSATHTDADDVAPGHRIGLESSFRW